MENKNSLYTVLTIGGNDYNLRLGARQVVDTERKLGCSILTVLMSMGSENQADMQLIQLEKLLIILHGSLVKYNANVSLDTVYDLYDIYVEDGKSYMDLVQVLIDVIANSGFFNKAQVETMNKETVKAKTAK